MAGAATPTPVNQFGEIQSTGRVRDGSRSTMAIVMSGLKTLQSGSSVTTSTGFSQIAHVDGAVADRLLAAARRAVTAVDPADNKYLQWILAGRHLTALPCALRPEHWRRRRGVGRSP